MPFLKPTMFCVESYMMVVEFSTENNPPTSKDLRSKISLIQWRFKIAGFDSRGWIFWARSELPRESATTISEAAHFLLRSSRSTVFLSFLGNRWPLSSRRQKPKTFCRRGVNWPQRIRIAIESPFKASSGLNHENLSDGWTSLILISFFWTIASSLYAQISCQYSYARLRTTRFESGFTMWTFSRKLEISWEQSIVFVVKFHLHSAVLCTGPNDM
jgi:hypothetical protein